MKLRFLPILLLLLKISLGYGQKVFSNYPFVFDQFTSHKNILNPAFTLNQDGFLSIQTGYNGLNQLSNKLSSFYLNTRFQFGKSESYWKHSTSFYWIADQEGEYLSRNKIQGQYCYSTRLNEKWNLSSGLSLGFVQNVLKPNEIVGSESKTRFDLDAGLRVFSRNLHVGLSINQIPNASITFFNGSYPLKRYLCGIVAYTWERPKFNSSIDVMFRTGKQSWNQYCFGYNILYSNMFYGGLYYKWRNGIVPQLGLKNLKTGKSYVNILFSYKYPLQVDLRSTSNVELLIELFFK